MRHRLHGWVPALAPLLLGLVFVRSLPVVAGSAGYLLPVAVGVALGALAAAGRIVAGGGGRADGALLALAAALVAFIGQSLNLLVGLPAAEDLRGGVGWAGGLALACEVAILVHATRALRGVRRADVRSVPR